MATLDVPRVFDSERKGTNGHVAVAPCVAIKRIAADRHVVDAGITLIRPENVQALTGVIIGEDSIHALGVRKGGAEDEGKA